MKHVKLFESFMNEGSYTDFLMNYSDEIRACLKKLQAIGKVMDKIDDAVSDKLMDRLKVYDTNVEGQIQHWAVLSKRSGVVNADDIARFAMDNQNRWGTEPQMVLQAIDDAYSVISREIKETPEVEEED